LALLGRRLAVSLPDTVLEEQESPRYKTAKLGLIARACAIYGVDLIEVFRDPGGKGESDAIRKVLEYLETPQYLRKRLYPLDEALRYAGLLPPLRIPSHRAKVPVDKVPGDRCARASPIQTGQWTLGSTSPSCSRGRPGMAGG